MKVLDYIYQHSDNREITIGINIDLQKTFDKTIAQLSKRFTANQLHINLDKTCYSIFGHCFKESKTTILYTNGKIIPRVKSCKYLEIITDSKLKWQEHINYVQGGPIKTAPLKHTLIF